MDKKTAVFVMASLAGGGAEKVLIHILKNLNREKIRLKLFVLRKEGIYLKDIPPDIDVAYGVKMFPFLQASGLPFFVKLLRLPLKYLIILFQKWFVWPKLKRFCRDSEIVVGFLEQDSTYLTAKAGKRLKKKSVGWIHIDLNQHLDKSNKKRSRQSYSDIDKVIACSNKAGHSAVKLFPFLEGKLEMIYNPIEIDEIREMAREPVVDYEFNGLHIISVGRLEKQKGYEFLIQAHKKVVDQGIPHRLIILGNGSEFDHLKNLARQLGVQDSVYLPGFVANPYNWMAKADVFALSSRYEGLCNVIIEALAVGTPVVSFNCPGGPSEILDNGEYGLLVDFGDVDGLANGLKNVLEDAGMREKFAAKGLNRAEGFSSRLIMPHIERTILEL